MSAPLGHRDPMTFRKLPILDWLPLSCHVLNVERMVREHCNVELYQYIHELMQGMDPRESDWFKRSID